jgi:hypothetical protein
MKRFKLPLIIVGSLFALVLIAVVLAFTSGVQTWATRKALAGQPGMKGNVGSVSAGLKSAEIRDVAIEQDGIKIVAKQVDASYSASDYLSGKKIIVDRLVARGIEIDARNPTAKANTPPPAAAVLAPFAGVLNAIRLPGETRLGQVDVDAKVLLPNNQSATFTLTGGGLAPGQVATLKWKATFADATKGAALVSADASGEMKVRTTADLRIDAIELTGEATATGPGIPADRIKIELNLAQPAANAAETALARIFLVRAGAPAPEQLFNVKVDYAAGKPFMTGAWDLAIRSEQLAAVLASLGLPEVALTGKGNFSYNLETSAAAATGAIDGTVSKLDKLGAELAAIGSLKIHTAFDGGSGKESAQLNKLELDVATAEGRKFVSVGVQQKLSFTFKDKKITAERPGAELARIALTGVPVAWAQPVLKPRTVTSGDISGVFVVSAELDGSRVKLTAAEPLTVKSVTIREGDKPLVDRVTLSVSPSVDYTAAKIVAGLEKLSITTPDGDTLSGSLGAEVTMPPAGNTTAKPVTAFSAQLQGKLVALAKPYLPPEVGTVTVDVNAKGRHDGATVQISALTTKIDREGGVAFASVEALQALTLDLAKLQPSVPNATAPALRVKWGDIPLAWIQGYVPQSKFAGNLAAGAIEVAMLGADAVDVRATQLITARGVSVAMNNQEFLRGADFSTDLAATWKGGTLFADIKRLELKQGTTSVFVASVNGEVTPPPAAPAPAKGQPAPAPVALRAKGKGQIDADFTALAQQPALAAQLPLTKGTVSAKFEGFMNNGVEGKLNISAKNLIARQGATPLGSMELNVDAKLDPSNSGVVRIPLVVTKDNRRSDITIEGKASVKPGLVSFEGKITGDQLIVDDLQAFSALSVPPPANAQAQATPAPGSRPVSPNAPRPAAPVPAPATTKPAGLVKDTTPLWAGFAGRVDLNIKSIKQGAANSITALMGAFSVREDRLAIENISASMNGNPLKVTAVLGFDVKQARPYTLAGNFDLPRFDVGEFLRKSNPAEPPAIETVVSVAAKVSGNFANIAEAQDRVIGSFDFKGSKGVLRALNQKATQTANVAKGVAIGAAILGGFLGEKGQAIANKASTIAADASELALVLKDVPFDSVTISADRALDGTVSVKSLEFISPELHLSGTGRLEMRPGVALEKSPMALQLQLAGKNRVAEALNKAKQLDGKKDNKDFYMMHTPFTLGGTVEKPDSTEFWKNITVNTAAAFMR